MKASVLLLLPVAASLAACTSVAPIPPTVHPYKVVLMPIEGSGAALKDKPAEIVNDDVPLSLTPEGLDAAITASIMSSQVFSEVVPLDPAALKPRGDQDEMQLAADLARKNESDLILRIQVKSARMTDKGKNGSWIWSTLTWFMAGIPSFWIDDRSYDVNVQILAELYDPSDPTRPTVTVPTKSSNQDLDLWDRGVSPLVIVSPPMWIAGSTKKVSETLTARAMNDLLADLVEELRKRDIPSRFEKMDVVEKDAEVKVWIASRRRLRLLVVKVDGVVVRTWAETELVEDKESTPELFVYVRFVELKTKARAEVRVIAEDEAGGSEVRTLMTGGAR